MPPQVSLIPIRRTLPGRFVYSFYVLMALSFNGFKCRRKFRKCLFGASYRTLSSNRSWLNRLIVQWFTVSASVARIPNLDLRKLAKLLAQVQALGGTGVFVAPMDGQRHVALAQLKSFEYQWYAVWL